MARLLSGDVTMARKKSLLQLLPVSMALSLGFLASTSFPFLVKAESGPMLISQNITGNWNAFQPPKVGLPGQRQDGGGVRGGNNPTCPTGSSLTAVMPTSNIGLTVSETPTLFWYVPATAPVDMEFVLRDEMGKVIDEQTLAVTGTAGIVSLNPSKPLEVGKSYHWFFSMICNPADRAGDRFVGGWIKRVEMSSNLTQDLEAAKPNDRPAIYARESLWFDTVASLADLHRNNANDPTIAAQWEELLKSVDLAVLAKEPFVKTNQARLPDATP